MDTITIKNVTIGANLPKIILPIIGTTENELLQEIEFLHQNCIPFDLIEWRVDHFHHQNIDEIIKIAQKIRLSLPSTPILFTFRTQNEGGADIDTAHYIQMNCAIAASQMVDLIDVEMFIGDDAVSKIIQQAHEQNVYVVGSNHHFANTPDKTEIISRLIQMQELNADILKIAVMPNSQQDVLTLLSATLEMVEQYANRPIVTMSMGKLGTISRVSGAIFGSSMTFGCAQKASAPGQLEAKNLRTVLNILK